MRSKGEFAVLCLNFCNFERSVITFKITVVHLVMERPQLQAVLALYQHAFKARMCRRSRQRVVLQVKQDVERVCGNHKMDQH